MVSTVKRKVRPPKSAKRKTVGSRWVALLIVLISLVSVPFTLWGAGILALSGPASLAMLYPFVVLVRISSFHIPSYYASQLAQWLMYLQFPLYGIFMAWVHRNRGFWIALNAVVWLHVLAWLLAAYLHHIQYVGF